MKRSRSGADRKDDLTKAATKQKANKIEPPPKNDSKWLTLAELRYILGNVKVSTKFWLQVSVDATYPYVYLKSSNFSMGYDAIGVNPSYPSNNITALFTFLDTTPSSEPEDTWQGKIQSVCSDNRLLTGMPGFATPIFLTQDTPLGSTIFTFTPNPQIENQYVISVQIAGATKYLTTATDSRGLKTISLVNTRPSVYPFRFSAAN